MRGNTFLFGLFLLLSTSFFLYQHSQSYSWDFGAYELNAKYWFAEGDYFEPYRPPLMPLALGVLSIMGWQGGAYAYIILVSLFYAYCCWLLAKAIGINPLLFYAASLSPFVLQEGLFNGTELLGLCFVMLAVVSVIAESAWGGFFLALAALVRYTNLSLLPLLFFQRPTKIVQSLLLYAAAFVPWFLYNKSKFGNYFTSIADQYAQNVLLRQSYVQDPLNYFALAVVLSILLPFMIIGIVDRVRHFSDERKVVLIMAFLLLWPIISYAAIPLKITRYLFIIVLPGAYFACHGLMWLRHRLKIKISAISVGLVLLSVSIAWVYAMPVSDWSPYERAGDYVKGCRVVSNHWVWLNVVGVYAEPTPTDAQLGTWLDNGTMAVYYPSGEPEWSDNRSFLRMFPVAHEEEDMIILGDQCVPHGRYEASYLEQLQTRISQMHGYEINTNPCFVLLSKVAFAEKSCNWINGNGFVQDELRRIE